jgi:hypothetical protein
MTLALRALLNCELRKIEAELSALKTHCSTGGAIAQYKQLDDAQEKVRDAITDLAPDLPQT